MLRKRVIIKQTKEQQRESNFKSMLGKRVMIKQKQKPLLTKSKRLFIRQSDGSKKYLTKNLENEEDKPVHFQLELEIEKTFTKNFYDHDSKSITFKKGDTVIEKLVSHTYYDKKKTISDKIRTYEYWNSYCNTLVISSNVVYMDDNYNTSDPVTHLMKRSFVLKED